MANYENIRPYSEFSHEAALHGGVEKYLDIIAASNRQLGIAQEQGTEWWKGLLLLAIGIPAWEMGKKIYRSCKNAYLRRKQNQIYVLEKQADDAKATIVDTINNLNSAAEDK